MGPGFRPSYIVKFTSTACPTYTCAGSHVSYVNQTASPYQIPCARDEPVALSASKLPIARSTQPSTFTDASASTENFQ